MKKKSSQSAFFNLRVLMGLFVVLAGVFLALLGLGTFSHAFAQGKGKAQPQLPRAQVPYDARGLSAPPPSQPPMLTSGPGHEHALPSLPPPQAPQAILYDQYDNLGTNATSSQDFEAALDPFDDELADDFVVPGGATWCVESIDADGVYFNGFGPAQNFNVRFYTDSGGLPGTLVESRIGMSYVQVGSTFTVTLSPAVSLTAGTYWVSVQARQDFTPFGQWGWTDRTVQSNSPAAWQNPGGGFGVCITWGQRGATCGIDPGVPDQVYRLNGTIGSCGTGTPTPTPTPTPPPGNALWYNGDYDGDATGNGLSNEQDTFATGFSHVFDDFIVADSGGWDITSVFSNNQVSTNITSATWEIRQGVSAGNGGTLVASGSTDAPVITPTGRFGFGLPEFTVEVTGLSVHLPFSTDPYWLNVTPVDNLDGGRSFNSTTLGANCVGTPCGNDQMAFFDSTLFGFVFEPTLNLCPQCGDFSMGVNGTVSGGTPTPTPGQLVLKLNQRRGNDRVLVRLKWTGATTPAVKIFRNGALLATVPSVPNTYTDTLTEPGIYTYQVCEKVMGGTGTCSNEKNVRGP
jgi:hypothetical protein